MNKKSLFLNLLSVYGIAFSANVKSVENKKFDYDEVEIFSIATEDMLNEEAMNLFCENCN